jgi:hypothetical protein
VVAATQDLGLIASSTAAGSPDSAAGIGITSSVLDAAISPTASPCNGSWLPDGATVHAPSAHTSINHSALRIIQTSFDVEVPAFGKHAEQTADLQVARSPRASEQYLAAHDKSAWTLLLQVVIEDNG